MDQKVIPIVAAAPTRERRRQQPKGRRVDPAALAEVRALLGDAPRRRDLLIEHLHRINDRYGQLGTRHLAALAQELRMAQAEVYEVASFYHHFDVVRDDGQAESGTAPLAVRVCGSLSCELAGAGPLIERLRQVLGAGVRVVPAPCLGRCEQAPVAMVGQRPISCATADTVQAAVASGDTRDVPGAYIDYAGYVAQGGYRVLRE